MKATGEADARALILRHGLERVREGRERGEWGQEPLNGSGKFLWVMEGDMSAEKVAALKLEYSWAYSKV